jgi:hypothetical protein
MNTRISLVLARPVHINRIANNIREIDRIECGAFGRTPKQSLRIGLARSSQCWTALVNGQPHAMFGVVVESLLGGIGIPWMLGTEEIYDHGRELLMWGRPMINRLHDSSLTLRNVVSSDNHKAIRLLKRWGFTVEERETEIGGVKFRMFFKEPERV